MQRNEYLSLRCEFEPKALKLIIVAESPPKSLLYFYKTDGKTTEPLFRALMKQIGVQPETKLEGLCKLREHGWLLVDATYKPVNEPGDRQRRDSVIKEDYPELIRDLDKLLDNRRSKVPLVLIKANVCRLLEPKLTDDGFNVLNEKQVVYFPAMRWEPKFHWQFHKVVGRRA